MAEVTNGVASLPWEGVPRHWHDSPIPVTPENGSTIYELGGFARESGTSGDLEYTFYAADDTATSPCVVVYNAPGGEDYQIRLRVMGVFTVRLARALAEQGSIGKGANGGRYTLDIGETVDRREYLANEGFYRFMMASIGFDSGREVLDVVA